MAARTVSAQSVVVSGSVVDLETGRSLPGATVEIVGVTGGPLASTNTDAQGAFRVSAQVEGRYAIVVSALGHMTRRVEGVDPDTGVADVGTVALSARSFELNPFVVSASRSEEKALEAPASIHVVDAGDISARPATSVVDHIADLPGVDVVTSGISRHSVATRGFNSTFNSDVLVLTDNRWAAVPSLRFNAFNLIAASDDDIERIEVVLGPGAALYGANTANGVIHLITKSPLESQGSSIALTAGERSVFQGSFRHARLLGESAGLKLSGTYFRGRDWHYTDPVEAVNRDQAIAAGADPSTLAIGRRDFDAERFHLDARVDLRPDDESRLVLAGGVSRLVSSIEQLTTNTGQANGWTYSFAQARYNRGRLFAQAYANFSDAGDSYLLRSGAPIVDRSRVFAAQVQHGLDMGERLSLTYGGDVTATNPRTGGTIHGAHEDEDDVNELGAYAQGDVTLTSSLRLVAAARVDRHDALDETVFSPRAALVLDAADGHTVRATYNRAFLMPTTSDLFADLLSSPTLGGLPFGVSVQGQRDGWAFSRACGGLCMRSPFTPSGLGGPSQLLPLDATLFWGAAVQIVAAQDPAAGGVLGAMAAPTASEVGTVMRSLNPETLGFDPVTDVSDIEPLRPSITNTFEVGYKGLIADRLLLGADLYYSRVEDFVSAAFVLTPNVFLDPTSVGAHIASEAVRLGLPLDAATIAALTQGMARVPVATVTPVTAPSANGPADVLLTVRNFGEVDYWGADLSATLLASERVSLSGSYSLVSDNLFEDVGGFDDVPLNAPRNKASLTAAFDDERRGFGAEVRGRWVEGFPFAAGVFSGAIDSYTLVDARVSYGLPFMTGTEVALAGTNLFDDRHRQAPGAPLVGRLVMIQLRSTF